MKTLRAFWLRLASTVHVETRESFAEELEGHLQMHTEDNLRKGMSTTEARRDALMKLGGIEQTKELYHDRQTLPVLDVFMQDVRYGLRMLRKNPGFTAVAVLSLALGIGANTTIFTVVNAVLLRALPVRDLPRLVEMDTVDTKTLVTQARAEKIGMSFPNFQDYRRDNQVFTDLAAFLPITLTWSGGSEPRQLQGELVSANYFEVLGIRPAQGRFFMPDEDTKPNGNDVAVLSYALWANKLGSDPSIIGKPLILDARPYTVIGIAPRGFRGTITFFSSEQVWIPTSMKDQVLGGKEKDFFNDRRALTLGTFGRLKPGIEIGAAEASLKTIATHLESEFPKDNSGRSVALSPLADAAVGVNDHKRIALAGAMMMGVVGLVLLIACVNLANLLLAQGARRQKEIALRAALGANRSRIVRQMLTESMLLSLAGGVVGLALAYAGRSILWSFRPPFIDQSGIDLSLDSHVLLFTLGVAILTGFIFGLVPAVKASRPDLMDTLKAGGRGGTMGWRRDPLRSLLVIGEMALALIALVGAGLFLRSMQNAQKTELGFESKNLLAMNFDLGALHYEEGRGQQFYRAAIEKVKNSPGVASASVASNGPLAGGFARTVFPEGRDEASGYRGTLTTVNDINPDYFETLRIPMLRGRLFTDGDRKETASVAIASEAMVKQFWPNENGLGQRFHFFGDTTLREIVGVVANSVVNEVGEAPQPIVFLPMTQDYVPVATLQVRTTGHPEGMVATTRAALQSLDPNLAITNIFTIEQIMSQALWAPRMGGFLLALFGGLALLLSAVGVYGVLSYSVNQQTREIGLRMALGAQRGDVMRLILGQGLRLTALGLSLGVLVALGLMRVLASLLFDVRAYDPSTYTSVTFLLTAVALLACYIPARRAMRVDPMVALRYD
ncbi:MAG TPA: ABC transporter permease [Candidatus Acidoferrum sp.]|nr:ABC transporter permease [Candidatus Acidoferrum sp.]